MTLEQLKIFLAVAEREHLTQAAGALHLTASAVSASIKTLEEHHHVKLFSRVGRGIELTTEGRMFLQEARETLARARAAELALGELGGLRRGRIDVHASLTIANYWLPQRLLQFHERYPGIELHLTLGNTATVAQAVIGGTAELGFIEGSIDEPALSATRIATDELVIVVPADHVIARSSGRTATKRLAHLRWILREPGSGTRTAFEHALRTLQIEPEQLNLALTLPSNEAILTAVQSGQYATALSRAVVAPLIASGQLKALSIALPPRDFILLRHPERHLSSAARELQALCSNARAG